MSDLDLCYLSATQALQLFRARELSPVELLNAQINRAEAVEPATNALTFKYFDVALEAARGAEARYANGEPAGALDGLPIGIKDESYIAGQPTSSGSLSTKGFVPDTTSIINARIMAAGGIVHARTATPEFSCAGYCNSRRWGVTRNPWNPEFTPGGSSGGSAASLASGTSSLATGSDIGGSIRIPAGCSGVVGFKPPYGRVPEDPPFNLDFYCHAGPLARTVPDTILLQNVVAGPHPGDIASLKPKLTLPGEYPPVKDWKIAYSPDLGFYEVDPDVRRNTEFAVEVFRSLGATVEEIELSWTHEVLDAALVYLEHLFGTYTAKSLTKHEAVLTSYARAFAKKGLERTPTDFLWTLEVAGKAYEEFGPLMENYDVLICPTNGLPAVPADFDQSKDTLQINGKDVNPMLGWVMTAPFNMLSRCPVLSVPSGRASNGVPTGIQIVGKTYCDEDVFRAAMAYEREVGPWYADDGSRPMNA